MRELRNGRELTQEELGEKLGVSRQTVISIEKQKYNPSLELAVKISDIFEKSVKEIFKTENND